MIGCPDYTLSLPPLCPTNRDHLRLRSLRRHLYFQLLFFNGLVFPAVVRLVKVKRTAFRFATLLQNYINNFKFIGISHVHTEYDPVETFELVGQFSCRRIAQVCD